MDCEGIQPKNSDSGSRHAINIQTFWWQRDPNALSASY
jgi:hypothetical protein